MAGGGPADPDVPDFSITFHPPAPGLERAVLYYWVIRGCSPSENFIEPNWPAVGWLLSGEWSMSFGGRPPVPFPPAWVCGCIDEEARGEGTAGTVMGFVLLPWGWAHLIDAPASAFSNALRPMADAFGPEFAAEAEAVGQDLREAELEDALARMDRFLLDLAARRAPPQPVVQKAFALLVGGEVHSVSAWAAGLGLSTRQLERLCLRHFGFTPKRLLKRERMLRTVYAMRGGEAKCWSALLDPSYADQPQFVHEFRKLMGIPPGAWRERPYLVRPMLPTFVAS
jgi:AraC-like DNA-binding protein